MAMRVFLCVAVAVLHCARPAHLASMNVHSVVADRALRYYAAVVPQTAGPAVPAAVAAAHQAAIEQFPEALYAGADFPDFLYVYSGDKHDAAEVAHWPTFHKAAVEYIREIPGFDTPGSWTEDTKKLVAFVYGLSVHYITDELWEGLTDQLGTARGFVEQLGAFNLGNSGDGDQDENAVNFGGDFYVSWVLNETRIDPWSRYFPLKDLVNIYHRTPKNHYSPGDGNFTNITLPILESCEPLFDLGLWALKTFGAIVYPAYNEEMQKIPFVAEHVFDTAVSGIDDMAANTAFAWARLARWFVHAPPSVAPLRRPVQTPDPSASAETCKTCDADAEAMKALFKRLAPFAAVAPDVQKVHRALPAGQNLFELVDQRAPVAGGVRYLGPAHMRQTLVALFTAMCDHFLGARFQLRVVDPTSAGRADAQAPPASAAAPASVPAAPGIIAAYTGAGGAEYFGSAAVAGDFNGSGRRQVAVGAIGVGSRGATPREGQVQIFSDDPHGQTASTLAAAVNVLPGSGGALARFGQALAVLDFNLDGVDDLVVGAPGSSSEFANNSAQTPWPDAAEPTLRLFGMVHVFFGQRGSGLSAAPAHRMSINTSTAFTALGGVLQTGDVNGDGHFDLLLGCPAAESASVGHHAGRVVALISRVARAGGQTVDIDAAGSTDLDLAGPAPLAWFGQALGVTPSGLLLVGAPFFRSGVGSGAGAANCTGAQPAGCMIVGRVYGFNVTAHGAGKLNSSRPLFSITGSEALGGLGTALAVTGTGTGVVAMSVPDAGGGFTARRGSVALLRMTSIARLRGDHALSALRLDGVITGALWHERVGTLVSFADLDQDGADELICGAPHRSPEPLAFAGREHGAVYVWSGTALPSGPTSVSSASWTLQGTRAGGRMGVTVAAGPNRTVWVGSPRAGLGQLEQAGAVDVLRMP